MPSLFSLAAKPTWDSGSMSGCRRRPWRRSWVCRTRACRSAALPPPCAAKDLLLVADSIGVPRLQRHPDFADDLIGPPFIQGWSLLSTQTNRAYSALVLTLRVPSLNPNRFRGVCWPGPAEARPNPVPPRKARRCCGPGGRGCARRDNRPGGRRRRPAPTDRRRADGVEVVPVERGQIGESRGPPRGKPKRSPNSDGPSPTVTVRLAGLSP